MQANGTRSRLSGSVGLTLSCSKSQKFKLGRSDFAPPPRCGLRYPSMAPVKLGSMGYDGSTGIFFPSESLEAAYYQQGIALDFYRGWNFSWSLGAIQPLFYHSSVNSACANCSQCSHVSLCGGARAGTISTHWIPSTEVLSSHVWKHASPFPRSMRTTSSIQVGCERGYIQITSLTEGNKRVDRRQHGG